MWISYLKISLEESVDPKRLAMRIVQRSGGHHSEKTTTDEADPQVRLSAAGYQGPRGPGEEDLRADERDAPEVRPLVRAGPLEAQARGQDVPARASGTEQDPPAGLACVMASVMKKRGDESEVAAPSIKAKTNMTTCPRISAILAAIGRSGNFKLLKRGALMGRGI
ncbi:unnamed protein product [Nezara viridula]|uniref:Uncharacterized protein n=1 Tax=Nezara viridula TaxID=85310 RepID=A0A9P0MQA1_NEZVI|nr:unnamed protein product [Nezara viridula]